MSIVFCNVGLVGHVSNGKSTLVHALTGVDTKRSYEEQKRGATIRLGYANAFLYKCPTCHEVWCEGQALTPEGISFCCDTPLKATVGLSFVDCPGHHSYVTTMAKGSSLMDAAILVTDVTQPAEQKQTIEHLVILEALQVNNIIVVQNKCDLIKITEDELKQLKSYSNISEEELQRRIDLRNMSECYKHCEQLEQLIPIEKRQGTPIIPICANYGMIDGVAKNLLKVLQNSIKEKQQTIQHVIQTKTTTVISQTTLFSKTSSSSSLFSFSSSSSSSIQVETKTKLFEHSLIQPNNVRENIDISVPSLPLIPSLTSPKFTTRKIEKKEQQHDATKTTKSFFSIIRSFDVNRPGTDIDKICGGVLGGSVISGTFKKGDRIEIRPGRFDSSTNTWIPLKTQIISIRSEDIEMPCITRGGLYAIGTTLDPTLTKKDSLVGHVVGLDIGSLPEPLLNVQFQFQALSKKAYEQLSNTTIDKKKNDKKTRNPLQILKGDNMYLLSSNSVLSGTCSKSSSEHQQQNENKSKEKETAAKSKLKSKEKTKKSRQVISVDLKTPVCVLNREQPLLIYSSSQVFIGYGNFL